MFVCVPVGIAGQVPVLPVRRTPVPTWVFVFSNGRTTPVTAPWPPTLAHSAMTVSTGVTFRYLNITHPRGNGLNHSIKAHHLNIFLCHHWLLWMIVGRMRICYNASTRENISFCSCCLWIDPYAQKTPHKKYSGAWTCMNPAWQKFTLWLQLKVQTISCNERKINL